LLYSLLFDGLLGVALILFAVEDLVNPPYSITCLALGCPPSSPIINPWSWGVLYVGIILLVESLAVWIYVRKDREKNPT
jgi:hypothetical protein